jgi:hypothetical protein
MAVATAKVTVIATDTTQSCEHVYGKVAVDASPATYATGGIAMSLSGFDQIKSGSVPLEVTVNSKSANTKKYIYQFVTGTTLANGKLQIFVQDATAGNPLNEMAAGAIPAGVSGDTIGIRAIFKKL